MNTKNDEKKFLYAMDSIKAWVDSAYLLIFLIIVDGCIVHFRLKPWRKKSKMLFS